MENENNSNKDLSKRSADRKNAIETESRSLAESKIFIIEATSEEEERSSTKGTNSFLKEAMKENRILKETATSESYSKGVGDIEKSDKSGREHKEDTVTKIIIADQLDETLLKDFPFDRSKGEIKNPRKIGDMAITDRHRRLRPLCDIIGKREQRRNELEKMEGDLRQRLDMLECSMPAVMIWNTWRMSQGAPICKIKRILEKQFKDARELSCRSTPSCHYDYRVREVEAERKLALKKMEEARTLWSEKLATLEERKRKLDEAKRIQEEQKNAMERLNEEARALQETMEKKAMEIDESCQCSDTQCKQRHLGKVSSVTSVESGDIQCLEKLQRLAEEEVIMKREIAELERREEAYMRTLQQADELWSKMEGDMVSTTSELQEQLDMKIAANQQLANRICELEDALEKCRTRLAACRAELEKFLSIEKVETTIGRDDDVAKVADKEVAVKAEVVHRPVGRVDDVAMVKDDEALARIEVADKKILVKTEVADEEALARVEVEDEAVLARVALIDADAEAAFIGDDKVVSVKPDLVDLAVDRPVDLVRTEDEESVVRPEDFAYEQRRFKEVREYLAKLSSLEELYKDDGEPCPPDYVCNDVVSSPTGMTNEELIALGIEPTPPTKKRDETLVVNEEERERQFQKELARKEDDVEKKKKKEHKIPDVEIEMEVVEKAEKRVAEIVDIPVTETVMPRTIEEEAADDRLVTMPNDVRATEIKEIEVDRGVVIQRDTILSWIDTIDTIRTRAAKHPDCRTVKKDADTLAEQVGAYVGIKPKEVEEETVTVTTVEETSAEVKAPMDTITESEVLPTLTKEEIPIGMEPRTAVSMEDSFQSPTIHNKEDLKEDTIPLAVPVPYKPEIEKSGTEETQVEEIVQNAKEVGISKNKYAEKKATIKDLINDKLIVNSAANDKIVNSTDKEEALDIPQVEKEEEKVISNHIERNEKKEKDIPTEAEREKAIVENEKEDEALPMAEIEESKFAEEVVEMSKEIPQLDETKIADIKETVSHMEIIRADKIAEVPPVAEMEEVEQDAKETKLAVDKEEIEEIMPEIISPTVDITEVEKVEPDKFPIIDVEKIPIADVVEEKIKIEEPIPILDIKKESLPLDAIIEEEVEIEKPIPEEKLKIEEVEKFEPDKFLIIDIEKIPIADAVEKKIKIEEGIPILDIKKETLPLDANKRIKEKVEIEKPIPVEKEIEVAESPPILDIAEKEKIETAELPLIADIIEREKIEAEVSLPLTDAVTKEKIEIIQPIPKLPTIKKEIEELEMEEQSVSEVEIKKEKDKEIEETPEEVTPSIELPEKKKEEVPLLEKEEILAEVPSFKELIVEDKKEVPVKKKKPEVVQIELKIPIAEIKSTEMEMPQIPIDPRLVAQPYLIIAKIKEKELLQIIPAKPPCMDCHSQPPVETAKPFEITQTNVVKTEIVQTEVIQSKVVQTEIAQSEVVQTEAVSKTEVVQITTQTVSTAEPPRMPSIRIISEYLKPTELKVSSITEITGDCPEITGQKMLWRRRLKDQSTVTTASIGSQTDKTSHVSHDRVVRDERERARVPTDELLRSIKIAAGLVRPDTEREIRTINYGRRSEEMGKMACNCCLCGRTSTSPLTRPRLEIQPQIDAKTAMPPAAAAFKRIFIRPKIDHPMSHDKLCPDCKAKIQSRMPRERHHVEKIIKKISHDQESCGCASLTGKSCRAVPRKRTVEKRDQGCLAKIPKRKTNLVEQKRKDDLQSILEKSEESSIEPLSPSCICYKLGKTVLEPIRKGNCYCAD